MKTIIKYQVVTLIIVFLFAGINQAFAQKRQQNRVQTPQAKCVNQENPGKMQNAQINKKGIFKARRAKKMQATNKQNRQNQNCTNANGNQNRPCTTTQNCKNGNVKASNSRMNNKNRKSRKNQKLRKGAF